MSGSTWDLSWGAHKLGLRKWGSEWDSTLDSTWGSTLDSTWGSTLDSTWGSEWGSTWGTELVVGICRKMM